MSREKIPDQQQYNTELNLIEWYVRKQKDLATF